VVAKFHTYTLAFRSNLEAEFELVTENATTRPMAVSSRLVKKTDN